MNITHVCLTGQYTEGLTYQDNLLTKFHRRLGHDVTIITTTWMYDKSGKIICTQEGRYVNSEGIIVFRLKCTNSKSLSRKIKFYSGIKNVIEESRPDILFVHGVQSTAIREVVEYLNGNRCTVYVDNHADYSNSGKNILSKYILHGIIWKWHAHLIEPYVRKFYGVLPARVTFLTERYGISAEKCEYLPLGADDDEVERVKTVGFRNKKRNELKLNENDFVVVSGGKIDAAKRQVIELMKAVAKTENPFIKLLVFGSVEANIKEAFQELLIPNKIIYLGWADEHEAYEFFEIADLVWFPGRHSVYWEQAVALMKPLVCKYWEGATHIDIGGNVLFIDGDSKEEMHEKLTWIIEDKTLYKQMKRAAENIRAKEFLYSNIAKQSIEYVEIAK